MRKVIDRKIYDTETAVEIGSYWNGCSFSDFNHVQESLYKTKRGNYFLAGKGGAMSKYGRSCGSNTRCGGEDIFPLNIEEALNWAEKHCDTETTKSYFDNMIEEA